MSPKFTRFALAVLLGGSAAMALAAGKGAAPLLVKPWVYDPDSLGISSANWVDHEGLPDAGNSNHALVLTKDGETSANAASGATVTFTGNLTELGFDIRNDSHVGAGAPRFNVSTPAGTYFFGSVYGTHTVINADWTRIRFSPADAFPAATAADFANVTGIDIVFDEGTDQGNGYAVLDNIDVNGTIVGRPGNGQ